MGAPAAPNALTPAAGAAVAALAVAAIAARLAGQPPPVSTPDSPAARTAGASFVTLRAGGQLRGCVGTLVPTRPLHLDVTHNAVRAMTDPRLPPVTVDDWPRLDVCVSVLSPAEELACADLTGLAAALRPGVDGLILARGSRRATFLPTVWQALPDPGRFVAALLAKGGWPADGWPAGLVASRYTTVEFHDCSPRAPTTPGEPGGRAAAWQDGGYDRPAGQRGDEEGSGRVGDG